MKHIQLFEVAFLTAVLLSGCAGTPKEVAEKLGKWHAIQDEYAKELNRADELGNNTSILAVKGFIYELGTPMNDTSALSSSIHCSIPKTAAAKGQFAPQPAIALGTSVDMAATSFSGIYNVITTSRPSPSPLSDSQKAASAKLPSLNGELSSKKSLELHYSDLTFELLPDPIIKEYYRKSSLCLQDIKGRSISILRGYIYGKLIVRSSDFINSGLLANVGKISNFVVSTNDEGGFAIEDTEVRPRFMVVSRTTVPVEIIECPDCPIIFAALDPQFRAIIASAHGDAKVSTLASRGAGAAGAGASTATSGGF